MRRLSPGITYTNVVATIALFLALTGGTVWAANKITSKQIGKGAVKNKNLAKNAVKNKNLAKNAVSSPKIAKNGVKGDDIADGVVTFAKLAPGAEVVASSSTGPVPAAQTGPVSFNPPLAVTPVAGALLNLHLEGRANASPSGAEPCAMVPIPVINGKPRLIGLFLQMVVGSAIPGFPNGLPVGGISLPIGLTEPGVTQSVTLEAVKIGTLGSCTPNSTFEVRAVVTEAR